MRNPFHDSQSPDRLLRPQSVEVAGELLGPRAAQIMRKLEKDKNTQVLPQASLGWIELTVQEREEERIDQRLQELYASETRKLSEFFDRSINVPLLPREITHERFQRWQEQGLALHYLPQAEMGEVVLNAEGKIVSIEIADWPTWKKKPDYTAADITKLSPDILSLQGGWVLIDTRPKPERTSSDDPMYQDDFLGPVLEELRAKGIMGDVLHPQSRFNVYHYELEKPEVMAAFAKAYGVKPTQIRIQREIEFNIIGNIHHPEWNNTRGTELFYDRYDRHLRLFGGSFLNGGLSDVDIDFPDTPHDMIGFRLIVRFLP